MKKYPYQEFSGAVQQKTTTHIRKPNEVRRAKNADFASVLGAVRRRKGAQATTVSMPKLPINAPALGGYVARFPTAIELWGLQNDAPTSPTASILQYWTGPNPTDWVQIKNDLPANSEVNMVDDVDEVWLSQYNALTDTIGQSYTIDSSHDVSSYRQLAFGPSARFFINFNGAMWAADVQIGANRYRDRLYKSSGPTGAVTFIRSPQTDPPASFDLVNQVPVMTSNTAPYGTVTYSSRIADTANYDAFRVFDRARIKATGMWLTIINTVTGWVQYDFTAANPKVITHYRLQAVATNSTSAEDNNRAPKTWTLQGSNNGTTFTNLHTVTNAPAWVPGEQRQYVTTNTTAYRYYRINVTANQGSTTYLGIAELELQAASDNVDMLEVQVDSVRYVKPGMTIDIYKAGTEQLMYRILPQDVDKIEDTVKFLPDTNYFATTDVNTSTDIITVPNAPATGIPIIFASSGAVPTGLTAGTTYYSIKESSTTLKVATSLLNAQLGINIDITAVGSGSHRLRTSYVFGNKDEIWKSGRKGKLTRFWNVDYRNPEASDYIKLPPTLDGLNAIVAVGKISNRLFPFTETAMFKFDGQNINPLRNDVGCAAHKSIGYYDSFMIWLDNKGNIWMRNEESGDQDVISESIQETMALIPQSQLSQATAVCVDDTYKLYLGQVDGSTLRVVYNFRTNQWTEEWWTPKQLIQLEYKYANNNRPHWFDENGQFWVDEEGTDDDGKAIHMEIEPGNDNFGIDELKSFYGVKVYSDNSAGSKIYVQIDGGEWVEVGQITKPVEAISLGKLPKGTMINFRITNSYKGDTPQIDKMTVWFDTEEDTFRATPR